MAELRELYQELILDHNSRPRNRRRLETADRTAEGYNPLCGDKVTVYLKLDGDVIREATFEGTGCAISTASASMMTEALKGKTADEAQELFKRFHRMLTCEPDAGDARPGGESGGPGLGKLEVFAGVRRFPVRVKCATLAWHTLAAAMENRRGRVSTE